LKLYAVRQIEAKTAVGFFWVRDRDELTHEVNALVIDPTLCEYKIINKRAAITWPSKTDVTLGTKINRSAIDADNNVAFKKTYNHLKAALSFEDEFLYFVLGMEEVEGWEVLLEGDRPSARGTRHAEHLKSAKKSDRS
jgi:hypothetical protein